MKRDDKFLVIATVGMTSALALFVFLLFAQHHVPQVLGAIAAPGLLSLGLFAGGYGFSKGSVVVGVGWLMFLWVPIAFMYLFVGPSALLWCISACNAQ